jgi:hypothetical protein
MAGEDSGFASKIMRHRQNGFAACCEDGLCPSVSGCPFGGGYAARPKTQRIRKGTAQIRRGPIVRKGKATSSQQAA